MEKSKDLENNNYVYSLLKIIGNDFLSCIEFISYISTKEIFFWKKIDAFKYIGMKELTISMTKIENI